MKISPARVSAFQILSDFFKKNSHIDNEINKVSLSNSLSEKDKSLCMKIIYGVLRNRTLLENIISRFSKQKSHNINPDIQNIFICAVYQIFFLDKIPVYAIVNDSVEIAKIYIHPKTAKFVNAILRGFTAKNKFTIIKNYINNIKTLNIKYSYPEWIIGELKKRVGDKNLEKSLEFYNSLAPLIVRTNKIHDKTDSLSLNIKTQNEELCLNKCKYSPFGIKIYPPINPMLIESFMDGECTVQDESSQLMPLFINLKESESFLDFCASPGGKISHIAGICKGHKNLFACDVSEERLIPLKETLSRLQINNVNLFLKCDLLKNINEGKIEKFDKILTDVPCSSLGTLRRHPEIRWKTNPKLITKLHLKQIDILNEASKLLKPKGMIFYSTCTFTLKENEFVISKFIETNNNFTIIDLRQNLKELSENEKSFSGCPNFDYSILSNLISADGFFISTPLNSDMDGFFIACLKAC